MKLLKKKKELILLTLLLVLPALSYSFDYTYGYTPNAALLGNTWQMNTQVLGPNGIDGMDIMGLIYQYEVEKDLNDNFTVSVQNKKADGDGFVFIDTEDWSQKHGAKIRKAVSLPYTPLAVFGEGAIATTGEGTVKDASVLYLYRFDACFDPQSNVNCAGYQAPIPELPPVILYDPLSDDNVKDATKETDKELIEDEPKQEESEKEEEVNERLEMAFFQSNHALMLTSEYTQDALIYSMNSATDMTAYLIAQIPSNVYRETNVMRDQGIDDNKRAWRSLSQDKKHYQFVKEQYEKN